MHLYIATLKTLETDTESQVYQQANNAHAAYYRDLISQGKFLVSGPSLTKAEEIDGGVFVLRAESREAANEIISNDPMVKAGFSSFELMEFKPILNHPSLEEVLNSN